MAWKEEMTEILRVMMGDFDETLYADENLQRVILVGAKAVSTELIFDTTFAVNVVAQTITPDPTATATRSDSFINLACLKGACIISHGSAMLSAGKAIAIRDGAASVDFRGKSQTWLALLGKGYCSLYEDAKFEYRSDTTIVAGAAVMSPFRLFAQNRGEAYGHRQVF